MSENLTRFHIRITREPGDPTYNLNIVGMYRSENDARQIWQSIVSSRYLGSRAEVDLVREMTSPFYPLPADVNQFDEHGNPRPVAPPFGYEQHVGRFDRKPPDTLTAEMARRAEDMLPPIEEIERKPSRSSADLALDGIKAEGPGTIVGRLAPEEGEARRARLRALGYRIDQSGEPLPNAELPGTAEHDCPADAPIASTFRDPHVPPQPPTAHKGDFAAIPAGVYNVRIVRLLAIGIELEIISPCQYGGRRFVMSPDEFNSADWGGDSIRLRRPYPVLPSKIKRQVVTVSGILSQQEKIREEIDKVAERFGLRVRFD